MQCLSALPKAYFSIGTFVSSDIRIVVVVFMSVIIKNNNKKKSDTNISHWADNMQMFRNLADSIRIFRTKSNELKLKKNTKIC